jgi:two-component system sensor histidine kinase KdpD
MARDAVRAVAAFAAVAFVAVVYIRWLNVTNATTVALTFLLVVLVTATTSALWVAAATSVVAMLTFNFFFLPPVGTFTIADPQNWVALFAFLAVSLVASNLSSKARAREREALERRDETARLFDLSRDVLLMTDSREAITLLARFIARRFDLDYVAICLPRNGRWEIAAGGPADVTLNPSQLELVIAGAQRTLEFDARERTYAGHRTVEALTGHQVRLVPLRVGTKPIGVLAAAGRPVDPGSLDALGGIAAIAIERVQLLEERKTAELARQREEFQAALLAALGHDLRTPLTAIRVAASNLQASALTESERHNQSNVVVTEVERLTRLFNDILDMARIDAHAVSTKPEWVHPSQIVDAAREQVEQALRSHRIALALDSDRLVRVDPRLTASALAHLLENAARYAPDGSAIDLSTAFVDGELVIRVRDHGPGIAPADLPRLFDRFYRGVQGNVVSGTGMGLSIARGLLAVERGRVWAENASDGGALFTIAVPAELQ